VTYPRLVLRNLFRHPLRTVFTMLSIALSIFLVCAVLTLPGALDRIVERSASNLRISVHHKAGLTYWLPLAFVHKIRSVPGVAAVNHWSWFGGIYDEPKNQFPNFALDPDEVESMWADYHIDPAALARFRTIRNGALVGDGLIKKFGWRIGQEVTLRGTIFPVTLSFQIVGVIPHGTGNPLMFWFNRKVIEEAMEDRGGFHYAGMIWVRADRPEHVDAVMQGIDNLFRNSEAEVAAETEKAFISSFFSSFQGFIRVILAVGFLVVAAVVLIAANTSAMGVRERIPEIAIMKSLGFRRRPLLVALLAESLMQSLIGGIVGAVGAYAIFTALAAAGKTGTNAFLGPLAGFTMSPGILAQGIGVAALIGLVAGAVPAWNGARLPVVQALRQIF
jgi:putative ABC transport system permease protein